MNATQTKVRDRDDIFIKLVDFKWLMSGVGWWVNLSRLQRDTAYMDECLQRAMSSDSKLLHERSIELLGLQFASAGYHLTAVSSNELGLRLEQ
jgi:hypothetical protein